MDGSQADEHIEFVSAAVSALAKKYKDKAPIDYSCVVYRNELSGQADPAADPLTNYCEKFGPTNSTAPFLARLKQVVPRNEGDKSDQRAVYFALKQAIEDLPGR